MTLLRVAALAFVLVLSGQAHAGGPYAGPPGPAAKPYCRTIDDAVMLANYPNIRYLRDEVYQRYTHAAEVANSHGTIYSTSPLFVWASEAKVSCAQAIGYLKKRWKWRRRPNYETLQKCECFYNRMTQYLRH